MAKTNNLILLLKLIKQKPYSFQVNKIIKQYFLFVLLFTFQLIEPMQGISNLCRHLAFGETLDKEIQDWVKAYLSDHSNATLIFQEAISSPYTLVFYKNFTFQSRKSGAYYKSIQNLNDHIGMLLKILSAASYEKEHESNILYSLQGELLAENISYSRTGSPQFIDGYIRQILLLNKPLQLKIHCALKIIISCLERIYSIRELRQNKKLKGDLVYRYVHIFAKYFILLISEIGFVICKEIQFFEYPKITIENLQSAQESFLLSVGRGAGDMESRSKKVILKQWEVESYQIWVECWCYILQKFLSSKTEQGRQRLEEILKSSCRSISLIHQIYQIFAQSAAKEQSELWKDVVQKFLLQFIRMILENGATKIELPSQFHASVLNLMRQKKILNVFHLLNEGGQYKHLVFQWIIDYCIYVAKKFNYYFSNFYECPVGLSMVVIYTVLRHFENQNNESVYLHKEDGDSLAAEQIEEKIAESLRIQNHHEILFKQIIYEKIFLNFQQQENEQQYQCGKDWKYFISEDLMPYFISFANHSPKFFKSLQFIYKRENDPLEHFSNLFGNMKQESINEEKLQILKKNPGFEILWNILNYLFEKFSEGKSLYLNPISKQKKMKDQKLYEDSIFKNVMPVIAMSVYLTQKCVQSEIKSFFCYEIYSLTEDICPYSYKFCQNKAKLCKLFIYDIIINQIFNQSFQTYGLGQSNLFAYICQKSRVQLCFLVDELMNKVIECISIKEDEDIRQNRQIIEYGIKIIEEFAKKISRRQLQEIEKKNDEQFILLSKALAIICRKIQEFTLLLMIPEFYKKVYVICCLEVKLSSPNQGIMLLNHIIRQTLSNNQFSFIIHCEKSEINSAENLWNRRFIFFLNGVVGLISSISKEECFKQVVEMALNTIIQIQRLQYLQIDKFNYQAYLDFVYQVVCPTNHFWYQISYQNPSQAYSEIKNKNIPMHSKIGLLIHDAFWYRLPFLLDFCRQIPDLEEKCMSIYSSMPKYEAIMKLTPLPDGIDLSKYPDVLDSYFLFIDRLDDISPLQRYYTNKIEWVISYLEKKIEKEMDFELKRQDLQDILMNISNLEQISDLRQPESVHLKLVLSTASRLSIQNLNFIISQCCQRTKKMYLFVKG